MIKYVVLIISIAAIFVVFSCTLHRDNSREKGFIIISIPSIIPDNNPAVMSNYNPKVMSNYIPAVASNYFLAAGPEDISKTRAYGLVTRLEVFIRNSGGTIVESWEFEWDGYPGKTMEVYEGNGYTIEIEIYNDIVSSSPTATGISDPFDVTGGESTWVDVTCLPTQAIPVVPDTVYSYGSVPTYYDYTIFKTKKYGGECWYTFTAAYDVTEFEITPEPGNHALLKVYNSNGESIGWIPHYAFLYRPEGSSCTLLSKTTTGETYYVVVCPITPDWDYYSTVDFRFYQGPDDDIHEENDGYANATPILAGEELSGLLLDFDYFQFTVDSAMGLTVTFDITITNTALYCISNSVWDNEENFIANTTHDNCTDYTPVQPFTITMPDEGSYYFSISPIIYGASYNIIWNYE